MILDFEYINKKLVISEINEQGNVIFNHYNWKDPRKFVPTTADDKDKHPKYTTWDKKPVKLVPTNKPNRFAIYEYIDALEKSEQDRLFKSQYPKTFFIDIETEILPSGFVDPKEATSRVLTVAIVQDDNVLVLGLKPLTQLEIDKVKEDIEKHFKDFNLKIKLKYKCFATHDNPEKEMMKYLFTDLIPKMPVITGWNFIDYDWTFLVNRCRRLGIDPAISSPTKKLEKVFGTPYEVPAHRLVIDYMEIWKKPWNTFVKVRESNSLDWVGRHLFKNISKHHYEGSLQDMYENNFVEYVFYNAVDTILVQMIHEKTRLLDIIIAMANLSKIRLCDFAYKNLNATLVSTEGFLRGQFREQKNIVLCKDFEEDDPETIAGGYVKQPEKGMQEWIATFDFASLYPTTQRELNIAPETFKGFQLKDDPGYAEFDGVINKIDETDIICVNGAVFSNEKSVTVGFLEDVYSQRKHYKGLMDKAKNDMKEVEKELKKLEDELNNL